MNKYDKDNITLYLLKERTKDNNKIFSKYLIIGFVVFILMLITALLPSYGYLPKMRVLDIIGEHCFIPVVVSIILGLSHNSIQAMKRLKGKTKGKIVGYNITRAIYRSRRYRLNYYYIPIVEYELNGINYRYLSNQYGYFESPELDNIIKNKTVIVKYNLNAPGDARIKYNLKQLIELNSYDLSIIGILIFMFVTIRIFFSLIF